MSGGRIYFKNDLHSLSMQVQKTERNNQEAKQKDNISKKTKTKTNYKATGTSGKPISEPQYQSLDVQQAMKIQFNNYNEVKDIDDELKQLFQSQSMKCQKKKNDSNIKQRKSLFFTPRCMPKVIQPKTQITNTLTIRQQEQAERKQKWQIWRMGQEIKKSFKFDKNQKDELDQQKQQQNGQEKQENLQGKDDFKEKQQQSVSHEKQKMKRSQPKKKKIKKEQNLVRQDLKRKYKDRFVGRLNKNLKAIQKARKMKRYGMVKSEVDIVNGQLNNSYVNSLSQALYVTLSLEDEDSSAEQQKIKYTIPDIFDRPNLEKLIQQIFGFKNFREGQFETINNILSGKSTLFVSETASGKSLAYVLSSIVLKGLSIVVSPLVSLMLDQLEHLPPDLPAACISSLLNYNQKERIIDMVKNGKINLLFVTPETFLTDFMFHIKDFPKINFVCIDEAHSLSQLSHSFRASYLCLQEIILKYFKYRTQKPVVLCLTATANQQTMDSICQKLNIQQIIRSKTTINKNLFITVSRQQLTGKYNGLLNYLNLKTITKLKGILIYCRTKRIMFQAFNYLRNSGIDCFIYHSGLEQKQKIQTLEKFRSGRIRVVIATVALGMGLDFGNLECVIHLNMPKSIENYIQQIGRAGRRDRRAYCHLFLDKNDYFVERNYFLADELENQIYSKLVFQLKKKTWGLSNQTPLKKTKKGKSKKIEFQKEVQGLKRLSINDDDEGQQQKKANQEIFFDDDEEQQINKLPKEVDEQPICNENSINNRFIKQDDCNKAIFNTLSYCRSQHLTELVGMKQEGILNILLRISKTVGQQSFKVLPMSNETIKIGFFKNNKKQLEESQPLFQKLIQDTKYFKGMIYIPLIKKCNILKMTPIHLLTEIYSLSRRYTLKTQKVNQIFVWQTSQENLCELQQPNTIRQIISAFNKIQRTALTKFNIFYSVCFKNSKKSLLNIISRKQIISQKDPLPQKHIINDFDQYFKQETYEYYKNISADAIVEGQEARQNDEAEFLPLSDITPETIIDINNSITLFLRHIITSTNQTKFNELMQQYRDGRIMTRVFMGVNDSKSSWKIYGEHPYWMRFKDKDYRKLLMTVKEGTLDFIIKEGPKFLQQEKKSKKVIKKIVNQEKSQQQH